MIVRNHSRADLPGEVRVELIHLLFTSLPQAISLAATVAAASLSFAFICGGTLDYVLAAAGSVLALLRIATILVFKRVAASVETVEDGQRWVKRFGALTVSVAACLALLVLRAGQVDRLDFFVFFFGTSLCFATGATARLSVVPWIPIASGWVMLAASATVLVQRPEPGCWIGGWFLLLALAAYTEACLHLKRMVVDKIMALRAVAWAAAHDALTGLPNRASFNARLARACERAARTGEPCAVLYLDLDRFKQVNDTMGHAAGDALLVAVTTRLLAICGDEGTAHRLGGDEFAVTVEAGASRDMVGALAERIVAATGSHYALSAGRAEVGVSIGIAFAPEAGTDPEVILNLADRELYAAKRDGRGRWAAAPGIDRAAA